MPNLLSLPRELRDDIYGWLLRGQLAMKSSHRPRIRVSKKTELAQNAVTGELPTCGNVLLDSANPPGVSMVMQNSGLPNEYNTPDLLSASGEEYFDGEESVRYPSAKPLPPVESLLCTNHQLRAEMQQTVRKNPVHYKMRLAFREDKELLYPTWISMPAFTDRIDTLDVEIRIRRKRTASIFSTTSSIASTANDSLCEGDVWFGGLVLLQRFLERGPSFLSRKKDIKAYTPITIACMTLQIVPKDLEYPQPSKQVFDDAVGWVNDVLLGRDPGSLAEGERKRMDSFLCFFAERIDRFAVEVEQMREEWVMKDATAGREEMSKRSGT